MYSGDRRDITVQAQLCISNFIMATMLDISYYIAVSWYSVDFFFLDSISINQYILIVLSWSWCWSIRTIRGRKKKKKKWDTAFIIHHSSFCISPYGSCPSIVDNSLRHLEPRSTQSLVDLGQIEYFIQWEPTMATDSKLSSRLVVPSSILSNPLP